MAGTKLGDAYVEISSDDKKLDRGLAGAKSKVSAWTDSVRGFMERIGQRLFDGLITGVRTVVDRMSAAIVASSDLAEAVNKTTVVFGSGTAEMLRWADTANTTLGMTRRQALDAAAGFGALFIQMGSTRAEAADMSQTLVELASDLSSLYNTSMEEALIKIKAGMAGETEPLRAVNIFLNEQVVQQRAVQMGLLKTGETMTDAIKTQARYAEILDQGAISLGDFSRNSREFANGQKILQAKIEEGSASLGIAFRPALTALQNMVIDAAESMFGYGQNITDQLAAGLAAGVRAIIPVIQVVRQLFTYWFKPGSPPKILPDIDEWGRGTMQAWLDGMAAIDVKAALGTIGTAVENILRSFVASGKMNETDLVSSVLGGRDAIADAVAEFKQFGSVSESTIKRITTAAGPAGNAITKLVTTYFDLQRASEKVKLAQDALNRATEQYDSILNPLRGKLDDVRDQQQALANQQRLIAAQNTLNNFDATAAEKQAAQLEIQQISLENQISLEEQKRDAALETAQTEVDTATQAEEAAQQQFDAAQATIDRQVETNNLMAEELRLQEQLANARKQAAEQALREAEAAANEQERIAKEAEAKARTLADAQLRYNLELADTPGQIALMEAELAKLTPGTAEYYDVLTRINQLQKQYKQELEAAAKATKALGATDIGPELDSGVIQPINEMIEAGKGGKALADAIKDAFAPIGPASVEVQNLAEKLGILFGIIERVAINMGLIKETEPQVFFEGFGKSADRVIGPLEKIDDGLGKNIDSFARVVEFITALVNGDWATAWSLYKQHATNAYTEVDTDTETKLGRLKGLFDFFQYATNLSWSKYWEDWRKIWTLATGGISEGLGTWLSNLSTKWGTWFSERSKALGAWLDNLASSFFTAGGRATTGFFDGLKSGWTKIDTWFKDKLQAMKNLLPFSEPKDPTSPLRGLGKSGESMINMIHEGMQRAAGSLNSEVGGLATPALAMTPAPAMPANNMGGITINQVFQGAADAPQVRKAANDGVLDAMRAAGLR